MDGVEQVSYSDYFRSGCHPVFTGDVVVDTIETKLCHYLNDAGLGVPFRDKVGVRSLCTTITNNQGGFLRGSRGQAIHEIVKVVVSMCSRGGQISIGRKSSLTAIVNRARTREASEKTLVVGVVDDSLVAEDVV